MGIVQQIKSRIKHSDMLGKVYVGGMQSYYKYLQHTVKLNDRQVLFSSFSGRQFSDSPKAIYDWLRNDPKYANYEFFWAFNDPDQFPEVDPDHKVKIDTPAFFKLLFASKYWVANTGIERLIPFNHENHVYIQTWHGVPLKHLGLDEANLEFLPKNWYQNVKFDVLTCSGEYDRQIFERIFPNTKNIQPIGLPRNYELLHHEYDRDATIKKLGLDPSKPILLYAPTFREYQQTNLGNTYLTNPFSQQTEQWLAEHYNVLLRGHYFTETPSDTSFIDVSNYSDLNELMRVSDILVTDYSSIMFDYALLGKPIFLYMYDFKQYLANRGTYTDAKQLGLSYALTEEEFISQMKGINNITEIAKVNLFSEKFNNHNTSISLLDYFQD